MGSTSLILVGNLATTTSTCYLRQNRTMGRRVFKKTKVIITRQLPKEVEKQLEDLFNAKVNPNDEPFSKIQLMNSVNSADVLICTVTDQIDKEVVQAAGEQLKLIANFGVGVNHIDLKEAHKKSIKVSNTPDVLTEDTADLAMALILMTARRLGEGERIIRAKKWTGWTPTQLLGYGLSGKSLGIIGMGRIGQALAKRARTFGMLILYHNRNPYPHEIELKLQAQYWRNLENMLTDMDFISLNTPYTELTANILDAKKLNLLKPQCILINTARGGLLDEAALFHLLKQGKIAAAGLDVFDGEPHVNPELIELENTVLLPHLGSATVETRIAMGERVIENILSLVQGKSIPDCVNEA